MPRRAPGTLLALEVEILEEALVMSRSGTGEFHGFGIARALQDHQQSRSLTSHGTLYKALGRMEEFGLLASRWESPEDAHGRPPRRLYQLTAHGAEVARDARADVAAGRTPRIQPGTA